MKRLAKHHISDDRLYKAKQEGRNRIVWEV